MKLNHRQLSCVCLAVVVTGAPAVCRAVDAYLCVAEMAAGLQFDKTANVWQGNTFRTENKVLVKRATAEQASVGWRWAVWRVGNDTLPDYVCKEDFDAKGFLWCQGFGEFRFNHTNLRFISTYTVGYVDDALAASTSTASRPREEGQDTPLVRGGKCSSL